MTKKLIYVHDPMCSWCFGFSKVFEQLTKQLPENIVLVRLLGGLAPDANEIMPESTQKMIQKNWQRIEQQIPGVKFNYDFWTKCQPRRSTYPSCRAVIAAREQGDEFDVLITRKIQQAYYCQARNPSDNEILVELAGETGLNQDRFLKQIVADQTQRLLLEEIAKTRSIGVSGFPGLILENDGRFKTVLISYTDVNSMLGQILD